MFVLTRLEALPRSTLLIDWFVLIALLGAPRLAYRLFKDRGLDHIFERAKHPSVPVLLISTKDGADTFIREMMRDPRAVYRVVGVLADTPSRVGREIYRVPVLGTIDALEDGGRAARSARPPPAKADRHGTEFSRSAGASAARARRRFSDTARAAPQDHRFSSQPRRRRTRRRADRARGSAGPPTGGARPRRDGAV